MAIVGIDKLSLLDYEDKVSVVLFSKNCNFRCPFCHNGDSVLGAQEEIDFSDILAFLKTRVGLVDAVVFSGGEPTLEDDLENNMYAGSSKFLEEKKQVTADMFNDMDNTEKEEYIKHEKIEVVRKIPSRSEKRKNMEEIEDNLIAEEMDKNYETRDNNNDSDLLNLIDSMYDKNGG